MKLALFSPYGSLHHEGGLIYLLANYLVKQGADVTQLRCDGALPACGRDKKHPSGRTPFSCLECVGEQKALASWAGVRARELSSFIAPDDLLTSAQWISSVSGGDLSRIEFRGVRLWHVCEDEFRSRWPVENMERLTAAQERDLRGLYVAYVHATVSSERFIASWKPTLSFLTATSEPLANAYLSQIRRVQSEAAIFSYDAPTESIVVEALSSGERYSTPLLLPNIAEMRADPRTWAPELSAIVHEMLSFLGHGADIVPA
jgi:hypothetical protein